MSTEAPTAHRPDACPDPEQLAAFIDGGLPPDERTLVEEHVADCPECRDILGGSAESLDEIQELIGPSRARMIRPTPPAPHRRAKLKWLIGAGIALPAAAAVFLMVRPQQPSLYVPEMASLVALETSTRATEGRLSGFAYAAPPVVTRGTGDGSNGLLAATAEKVRSDLAGRSGSPADAARGVTFLLTGDVDRAIESLERATTGDASTPRMLSDLAVAYLQRGGPDDLSRALATTQRAIDRDPQLAEARYNRALALERQERAAQALQAWREYVAQERDGKWVAEAQRHMARLVGS